MRARTLGVAAMMVFGALMAWARPPTPPTSPTAALAGEGVAIGFEAVDERWAGATLIDGGVKGRAARFGGGGRIDVGACAVDGTRAFALEVAIRTTHGEFATPLMAREGESVGVSLVMGRNPGCVSFEAWSWQQVKLISARRVDDGAWHVVRVVYSPRGNGAVMWIDGKVEAIGTLGSGGAPLAKLRLGNNIGTEQGFTGDLDEVSFVQRAEAGELLMVESLAGGVSASERSAELAALRLRLNPLATVIPATPAEWTARKECRT